jgi:Tfp pilus assembly protein PilV
MNKLIQKIKKSIRNKTRGFVLPFALIVCLIILTISSGITIILVKQLYFSKLSRQSEQAYYAADDGMLCTTMIDDQYTENSTGLGIFPYNPLVAPSTSFQATLTDVNAERTSQGLPTIVLTDIRCAASAIFDAPVSSFATSPFTRTLSSSVVDSGYSSSFNMKMDLGDGTYRQIISRGYAVCNDRSAHPIERAVINITDSAK